MKQTFLYSSAVIANSSIRRSSSGGENKRANSPYPWAKRPLLTTLSSVSTFPTRFQSMNSFDFAFDLRALLFEITGVWSQKFLQIMREFSRTEAGTGTSLGSLQCANAISGTSFDKSSRISRSLLPRFVNPSTLVLSCFRNLQKSSADMISIGRFSFSSIQYASSLQELYTFRSRTYPQTKYQACGACSISNWTDKSPSNFANAI